MGAHRRNAHESKTRRISTANDASRALGRSVAGSRLLLLDQLHAEARSAFRLPSVMSGRIAVLAEHISRQGGQLDAQHTQHCQPRTAMTGHDARPSINSDLAQEARSLANSATEADSKSKSASRGLRRRNAPRSIWPDRVVRTTLQAPDRIRFLRDRAAAGRPDARREGNPCSGNAINVSVRPRATGFGGQPTRKSDRRTYEPR